MVNALDFNQIQHLVEIHQITDVYLMAALLSATAEKILLLLGIWTINSLFHVLNLAKAKQIKKVFLAIEHRRFLARQRQEKTRPNTPLWNLQRCTESETGGRKMVRRSHFDFGVDVRSVRYPGLISWSTPPGGGTDGLCGGHLPQSLERPEIRMFFVGRNVKRR